jgi:anti-anti-sigma factor
VADVVAFTTSEDEGGRVVLTVSGEIDSSNADKLRRALESLLADIADRTPVVDLRSLRFIDTTGLEALVWGATAANGKLLLRDPPAHLRRVLDIAMPNFFQMET